MSSRGPIELILGPIETRFKEIQLCRRNHGLETYRKYSKMRCKIGRHAGALSQNMTFIPSSLLACIQAYNPIKSPQSIIKNHITSICNDLGMIKSFKEQDITFYILKSSRKSSKIIFKTSKIASIFLLS